MYRNCYFKKQWDKMYGLKGQKGGYNLKKQTKKAGLALAICLVIALGSMILANAIQTNFGTVDVVTSSFVVDATDGEDYSITYKMFVPKEASADNPLPAVLCLHGYQNDRETSAAYAMELARRGIVAVCIDEFGHGYNERSLRFRGHTTYKVQGISDDGSETIVKVGLSGPERFLAMMNFSTLSFFEGQAQSINSEPITIDADKDGVIDSSMGGINAYRWLQSQPFVQPNNIGITGHSMGTWASWSVAAACQDHVAMVIQCGEVFGENIFDSENVEFHNVLMLQAKYDEFNYFRDYKQETVSDNMLDSDIRRQFFTANERTESLPGYTWNTTYGSFEDKTARRVELLKTNHRLTTHDGHGIATAMDWFTQALNVNTTLDSSNQIYLYKEILVMVAMLAIMVALCPGVILIGSIPFFNTIIIDRKLSQREPKLMTKKKWWINAVIAVLISAVTYPFMTQLGHGLLPLPENVFRMTIGNGFMTWYITLALISIIMMVVSRFRSKKKGIEIADYYDLGLSRENNSTKLDWTLLGKSFLAATLLVALMYLIVVLFQTVFLLDLRFIWPFFKIFSGERFVQFLVYLPFFSLFFVVNVGCKLFGQMRQKVCVGAKNFVKCWMGNVVVLLGGLFVILLLEYIPFFMGAGPGADLLFGTTFGGPFMSALILLVPQFVVFTFLSTWLERKSGNVYVGAFISAMLATWIVTGGSAIF